MLAVELVMTDHQATKAHMQMKGWCKKGCMYWQVVESSAQAENAAANFLSKILLWLILLMTISQITFSKCPIPMATLTKLPTLFNMLMQKHSPSKDSVQNDAIDMMDNN
jgi:hypothetical protein